MFESYTAQFLDPLQQDCILQRDAAPPSAFREDEDDLDDSTRSATSPTTRRVTTFKGLSPYLENDEEDDLEEDSVPWMDDDHSFVSCCAMPTAKTALQLDTASNSTPAGMGLPHLDASLLGAPVREIGRGGDHGSRVYRIDINRVSEDSISATDEVSVKEIVSRADAYKKYPRSISANELLFVYTVYQQRGLRSSIVATNSPNVSCMSGFTISQDPLVEARRFAARHLVLPAAVVSCGDAVRGLLMPRYDCSLTEHLCARTRRPVAAGCKRHLDDIPLSPYESFLTTQRYAPIESVTVVTAIAFQILEAIALLNHGMQHNSEGRRCSGFTHNDIHLDNILLSVSGRVALCDFELVEHIPPPTKSIITHSRLPPYSRQSPHGLFTPLSDTWAFGLLILNLLSGVAPLFSSEKLMNDFGNGPLLLQYNSVKRDASVPVVDWESNIKQHADILLRHADPSGKLLEEARGLLRVCSKCLVNRSGASPFTALRLLEDDIFAFFRIHPNAAEDVVRNWWKGEAMGYKPLGGMDE